MYDVMIIGAGPAGLSAGIYANRAGLSALVLDKAAWGGQTVYSSEIENYLAVPPVTGPDFAQKMYEQFTGVDGKIAIEEVKEVNLSNKTVTTNKQRYETRTIVIATGLRRRKLGCPGESEYEGKGVSYCAICDGRLFTGKDVIVVGGGNTALEDALYLSTYCNKVTVVCRDEAFKGEHKLQKSLEKRQNVNVIYSVNPKEIKGGQVVEKVLLDDGQELDVAGVFVAIGYQADSSFLKGQIELAGEGYVMAGEDCKTSVEGVYVAGDLRTKRVRQIITAAADGAIAALAAADYILEQ